MKLKRVRLNSNPLALSPKNWSINADIRHMVYFDNEHWLPIPGESHFGAYISTKARKREDIRWTLDMQFGAGRQVWRRVRHWERPQLVISLSSFRVPGHSWKDLERVNFWDEPNTETEEMNSGFLDVSFWHHQPELEDWGLIGCQWRVAGREAGWLTD